MRTLRVLLALAVLLVPSALVPPSSGADPVDTSCLYPSLNDRFGVTVTGDIENYAVSQLSAGAYLNWRVEPYPTHPNNMAYLPMVRTRRWGTVPVKSDLEEAVRNNLGATWAVGNEAETVWMDNITPEMYAQQYHDVYHTIKSIDPGAQVVANGFATVSTLRLAWLDRVWDAYQAMYGEEMPVDIFSVHTYVVNEMHNEWGAEIPTGIDNAVGYGYGTWTEAADPNASGGTVHQSRQVGARAYFAFHGDLVRIFLRTGPDAGIANIYIDHQATPVDTIDLYSATPGGLFRTYTGLQQPGGLLGDRHNIRAQVTGQKNPASSNTWVRVDAVRAASTADLPGGRLEDDNPLRAKIVTSVDDHDNIDMIADLIRQFRQWMADHGQRDKPLINTEYGILMTEDLGFDYTRVRTFMLNSFDRFVNDLTDPSLGMPSDDNRMLQQWYWFAVDQDEFEGRTVNTGLFDTHTKQIKQLGVDYVNYVTPLAAPYVDLEAYYLALTPHWPIFLGDPSLVEMDGTVFNRGNRASGAFDVAVKAGSSTLQTWTVSGLTRRFGGNDHASFHYDWQQIINGDQSLSLVVDEADQVTEPCSDNNVYRKTLVAPQITDLALSGLTTVPKILPPLPHGQTATVRLQVNLENLGTQGTAADHIDVKFWLGDPDDGGVLIGSQTLTPGNVGLPAVVGFDWPDVAAGYYDVYAVVDAVPEEANRENNRQYARIIVPEGVAFMPTIDDNRYYRNAIEAESPGTSNPTLTPYWLP